MKKYVHFYNGRVDVRILRSSVVGFSTPDIRVLYTNVILESGSTTPLNGMYWEEAVNILDTFDRESE